MDLRRYCSSLDDVHKKRYMEKISVLGIDPYLFMMDELSADISLFPKIMYPDIVNYLVTTKSAFTMEEMKAYKSLEAYNLATCGWVKKICVKHINSHILVIGKVMHSQRLNEKPLTPWIISLKDGTILSAHCDCIAGLGEVCTHVAAVLFSIDDAMRKQVEVTRTGIKAYWMPPSNKPAEPCRVHDLNLVNPKRMKLTGERPLFEKRAPCNIKPINEEEKELLLMSLKGSVLHSVTRPFSEALSNELKHKQKLFIMNLHEDAYDHLILLELQRLGDAVDLSITYDECKQIERDTREQSKCKSWFNYRTGRVTASNFKKCCRTKLDSPSMSLIKSICYPVTHRYKIKALDYGCQHEQIAKETLLKELRLTHRNIESDPIGFFINPQYPYFGASPDGLVTCDCCGTCVMEIKCPYCARFSGITDLIRKETYLIERDEQLFLKLDHEYYYQVQMQMALTGLKSCYFMVWSEKDFAYCKVPFDQEFWERESNKAKLFFYQVILPEALGKLFTRSQSEIEESSVTDPSQPGPSRPVSYVSDIENTPFSMDSVQPGPSKPVLYCLCQQEDDKNNPMIACESGDCEIEWYHFSCVGLTEIPTENWICDLCKN